MRLNSQRRQKHERKYVGKDQQKEKSYARNFYTKRTEEELLKKKPRWTWKKETVDMATKQLSPEV